MKHEMRGAFEHGLLSRHSSFKPSSTSSLSDSISTPSFHPNLEPARNRQSKKRAIVAVSNARLKYLAVANNRVIDAQQIVLRCDYKHRRVTMSDVDRQIER